MTAIDDLFRLLGPSFMPEEMAAEPRAALKAASGAIRASRRPADSRDRAAAAQPGAGGPPLAEAPLAEAPLAEARLAVGFATLACGNVTAAGRLFGRARGGAAPGSAVARLAHLGDLLAGYSGYAFLPGGGSNFLLSEPAYRLNMLELMAAKDVAGLRAAGSEPWWPPAATLLGELLQWRRGVLGPDFQTGRMVDPHSAGRLARARLA